MIRNINYSLFDGTSVTLALAGAFIMTSKSGLPAIGRRLCGVVKKNLLATVSISLVTNTSKKK